MKYIFIGLMFFSSMLSADQACRLTDEYRQIAREARDIVYGDENSFSKCEHSGKYMDGHSKRESICFLPKFSPVNRTGLLNR